MNAQSKTKRNVVILFIILLIISLLSYFIGDYFVSFALIPNQGGQDRQVQEDVNSDQHQLTSQQLELIHKNQKLSENQRDQWLKDVHSKTERVSIQSHDHLTLVGHTFKQEKQSHHWVILVHGYQSNEEDALQLAPSFYDHGYNILTIDMRAHDDSQGDYIGMGILDRYDLKAWTEFLVEQDPDSQIVYHGTSMGGATVLMTSGLDLPTNVKAIISDCAYSDVWDIFASELKQRFNLSTFPVLDLANAVAGMKAGYHFKDASATQALPKNTLPILYIHSQKDDFVPIEMLSTVYEANKAAGKEKIIIQNAHHADSKHAEPQRYYQSIFDFLSKHIK